MKRLVVLLACVASYSAFATTEPSSEEVETTTEVPELHDEDLVVDKSDVQSVKSPDERQPSESDVQQSDFIDLDESSIIDRPSNESPPDYDEQNETESIEDIVEQTETELLGQKIVEQNENNSFMEENLESNEEFSAQRYNGDDTQDEILQENDFETNAQEEDLNADHNMEANEIHATTAGYVDDASEASEPKRETAKTFEAAKQPSATDTRDSVKADDIDHVMEEADQIIESKATSEEEISSGIEHTPAERELGDASEQLQSDHGSITDESQHLEENEVSGVVEEPPPDSEEDTQSLGESDESPVRTDMTSKTSNNELRYQPNCGVWGVYQSDSRYANISVLALLFQDLFQKDEAEATAILKDLASSAIMPMEDVLTKIQNVSEEISETVDSAERIAKSPNSEFVEGLDDIDKFFEGVDVPDELDVGAAGSSIQEVLMGQGTQIIIKRLKMGFVAIRGGIMTIKVSAVTSIEGIVSRREEFALKRDDFLRRLRDVKNVLVENFVDFRASDNERRKEKLRQLARLAWRVTRKTTITLQHFVQSLFEDGEDIQDILNESSGVDDEIQQMMRKLL